MLPEGVLRGHGKFKPQIALLSLACHQGDLSHGPPLQFTTLATLRAAPGIPLYDESPRDYPVLNPIRTQIPVRITVPERDGAASPLTASDGIEKRCPSGGDSALYLRYRYGDFEPRFPD